MLTAHHKKKTLKISDIVSYYKENIKPKGVFNIGVEWEKQSLDKNTLKNAKYETLKEIIKDFALIRGWGVLKEKDVIIGAYDGRNSISLEPGGQFELSVEPKAHLDEIERITKELWGLLDNIGKKYDVIFAPIGLTPVSTYQNIDIVPKERYLLMKEYFSQIPEKLSSVMMRETASIQINIDYTSEEDAFSKLRAAAYISPFITGFFANSYIRDNKLNGYKSYRANTWLDTDKTRCGFFYRNLFKKPFATFEDYVSCIIDVPVLFIERNNKKIFINGEINFREYIEDGYRGYFPTLNDYLLHSSLTFPAIRLKNYLEIRNQDSQKTDMMLAICALYKGLLSKQETIDKILKEFKVSFEDLEELTVNCAKFGLSFEYKDTSAYKIAEKIFKLSFDALDNQDDKVRLLKYLKMLSNKQSISDLMLNKNIKDARAIVDYSLN